MPFLRLLAGAVLLASAGEGSPLTISSGDVLVQATGVVYLDPFSSILVQGFFGSVDSIPSNAVGGGLVRLEGDHSGTISSGPHSNLQDVVLSFNRGMPSATGGVSFTSTSDAALADTVLTLLAAWRVGMSISAFSRSRCTVLHRSQFTTEINRGRRSGTSMQSSVLRPLEGRELRRVPLRYERPNTPASFLPSAKGSQRMER